MKCRTIALAALILAAGFATSGCNGVDDDHGYSATDCADEVEYRGVTYTASGPRGGPPPGLPPHVSRGPRLGEVQYCAPDEGEEPDIRKVFRIQGTAVKKAIFVQGFGPMVRLQDAP